MKLEWENSGRLRELVDTQLTDTVFSYNTHEEFGILESDGVATYYSAGSYAESIDATICRIAEITEDLQAIKKELEAEYQRCLR